MSSLELTVLFKHRVRGNMWIDTDIAEPSYDNQIVKVKVADFSGDYITNAYYNHKEQKWYRKDGI